MARKKRGQRKVRVDFRQNRADRRRSDEWTRRWHAGDEELADTARAESVRAKGALSRKRTIIVDEENLPRVEEGQWLCGLVTRIHGLICYVDDHAGRTWECTVRRVLRTMLIDQRSSVVVGDRVWFSDLSQWAQAQQVGVIERVAARSTVLSRRDRRRREHALVANADQLLIVTSVAAPRLKPHLIDRYLIAALKGGLRPLICVNKCDLLDESRWADTTDTEGDADTLTVEEVVAEFAQLGYQCLFTSATTGVGLDELRAALHDRVTVLSGQSGVGKSSLINEIEPGLALATREVSSETDKGRHTTTHAQLIRLKSGGYVVDTPGIRAFDLWNVEPGELEALFEEFAPLVAECRFSDCAHRPEEDGCAIVAAVEEGRISLRRYHSYLKLLTEV